MARYLRDEYSFDKRLEDGALPPEFHVPDEYASPAPEDRPAAFGIPGARSGRFQKADGKRREILKKLIFIPVAASLAALTALFASVNFDPLGMDFLTGGTSVVTPAVGFPVLPNLYPDFAGKYAWSGMGSEEYVTVDGSYLTAGTVYTDAGTVVSAPAGVSYDKASNTLTLNGYQGTYIDTNLMGNGFRINLVGENSLDYIRVWGAMYGGSVTFTGNGSLTLNKNLSSPLAAGLWLECEFSASCVMVERGVTLDVYGAPAVVIHCTTLEKAIYTLEGTDLTGGAGSTGEFVVSIQYVTDENGNRLTDENGNYLTRDYTVNDISKEQGIALYDYSVVDENGEPSGHVTFRPSE